MSKSVFVTVGTTSFDQLIETVTSEETLAALQRKGYGKITLQIGAGKFEPSARQNSPSVDHFRFKSNLSSDVQSADLVISHAGAGSIIEALEAKKHLIVVINENLMDNHQTELARQLHSDGYLFHCNCRNLRQTIEDCDLSSLKPYVTGDAQKFVNYVEGKMMNC